MAPRDLGIYPEVQTRPDVALDERPDLAKPSLKGLAWLLRHPEEWAPKHTWDFATVLYLPGTEYVYNEAALKEAHSTHCGTAGCAMGIAALRWGGEWMEWDNKLNETANTFPGARIFSKGMEDKRITPSVVAGRIDDYLAGRPIRYLKEGDRSAAHAVPE